MWAKLPFVETSTQSVREGKSGPEREMVNGESLVIGLTFTSERVAAIVRSWSMP